MKLNPLPNVNLQELHPWTRKNDRWHYPKSMEEALHMVASETDTNNFRNLLFAICAAYAYGICSKDGKVDTKSWKAEEHAIRALNVAAEIFVDQFYRGKDVDLKKISGNLDSIKYILLDYSDELKYRNLHMQQDLVYRFGMVMPERIRLIGHVDTIVAVESAGYEPALLAANILGMHEVVSIKYTGDGVEVPKNAPKNFISSRVRDKRVLVIDDDITWEADTIGATVEYLAKLNPKTLHYMSMEYTSDLETSHPCEFKFSQGSTLTSQDEIAPLYRYEKKR